MVGRVDENLMVKLLDMIPSESVSVHQLCCKTGIDHRTIKKYVQLIIRVQNSPRLKMETVGLRVLVRMEK
jgi:broad-specificity NMP kinase